jgi:hypothetical protein
MRLKASLAPVVSNSSNASPADGRLNSIRNMDDDGSLDMNSAQSNAMATPSFSTDASLLS